MACLQNTRKNSIVWPRDIADDLASLAFEAIETIICKLPIAPVVRIVSKYFQTTGAIGTIGTIIWKPGFNNLSPSHLADRLSYQSHSRVLRSASKQLIDQPRSITKIYGDKAFPVCAPQLWNSLPLDLRKSPSLTGFKEELKTYLFRQFLESGSLFL